jgi:hypothetical protein
MRDREVAHRSSIDPGARWKLRGFYEMMMLPFPKKTKATTSRPSINKGAAGGRRPR